MDKSSHLRLAGLLYAYTKENLGINLQIGSFIWGNLLPDYDLFFFMRPHFPQKNISHRYIRKRIQALIGSKQEPASIGKKYSRQLGIICHYYADFFCFAHNENFSGGLTKHMKYEQELDQYFQENYFYINQTGRTDAPPEATSEINSNNVHREFDQLYRRYLQSPPSYYHDLSYCILACLQAITLITAASVVQLPDELALGRLALNSI